MSKNSREGKIKMAASLNEESVEKKLKTVNNTQDSIQSLSLWIIHHKSHHAKIVELWMRVMKKTVHPSHRLTLFYLCNDVVQTCKKKKAFVYNATFKEHLREAAGLVRDNSVKSKVERIFNIWGERGVYDAAFIKSLHSALSGHSSKSKKGHRKVEEEAVHAPISPSPTPRSEPEPKEPVEEPHQADHMTERDAEESARILAEFKPHEMIDQITTFKRQDADIQFRVSQLTHLKLDASSIEAVKQLKDRAHGNDFSSQFEDSCTKLEDLVKRQTQHLEDQRAMLETLSLSETFYEEQYREAKIVANAYKNFGARINNMKKRLDELKRSMPEPDSPIPSPDVNAPSPGNTPPHIGTSGYGYNPAAPMNYGQGVQQNAWMYNGSGSMGGASAMNSMVSDNAFPDSPPLEAPSPEGSPPDLNLDGSDNATGSLESRLASFFDRNRSESSNPPVYTPQLSRPVAASSKQKMDEDGSATPLDDETPTTPVQDENLASPPKRSTPPKKENPIDFLSRLISQTQKAPPKTGAASFLDSLTMLTSVTKKPADTENQQQAVNPQSWAAWKAKSSENTSPSQPSSPTSFGPSTSMPTSPTQFPPTPTMVPPPIPMPVPPPSLSMGLSIPPPPPPPFGLASNVRPDFTTPPPGFQQTSPGQKENWPDIKRSQASDHTSTSRGAHSSVLKELVPADGMEATPGSHMPKESTSSLMDSDAMEIVSDEEDEEMMGSAVEAGGEAKAEFAQKLKQKTSQGSLKSHVFVPNPERPNLMTLTVQDDLDEEDMIDDNTVMEDAPSWSSKTHKSSHKSRSRSHSREKERSHKHKKKKKHKRNHSDDEDSRPIEGGGDEGKGISSMGSVVKKIDGHSSRNSRDSKGDKYDDRRFDKYDDDRKYDRYDDRKYDRYDERAYGGRGDYKSHKGQRGSKDSRDTVEAYTQAYRDAFFQQYSQARYMPFQGGAPPVDQRRSGYGKY